MSDKPEYKKPLPDMRPEGVKFWEGTKQHKFLLPTGKDGKPFWYPRALAPGTLDPVEWTESKGEGEVYTYSVHYIGPSSAYKGDPPHTVVLVDLDEGVRIMSNLVKDEPGFPSIDPDDVKIGMRVKVVYDDVTDDVTIPRVAPA